MRRFIYVASLLLPFLVLSHEASAGAKLMHTACGRLTIEHGFFWHDDGDTLDVVRRVWVGSNEDSVFFYENVRLQNGEAKYDASVRLVPNTDPVIVGDEWTEAEYGIVEGFALVAAENHVGKLTEEEKRCFINHPIKHIPPKDRNEKETLRRALERAAFV